MMQVDDVERVAQRLRDLGYGPGDEVAVDDVAAAADSAEVAYDVNDDEDMALLGVAITRVTKVEE